MKLIAGLGNPGSKHEKTRHNLGFMVLDSFLKDFGSSKEGFKDEKKFKSQIAEITWQPKKGKSEKIIFVKPQTYMNESGIAISLISKFYKIEASDIWIVHDEIDLPLGAMKIRMGGSSAGHKGVESIIEHLGTEMFWRFRLGIGPQHQKFHDKKLKPIDNFVIGQFMESEKGKAREVVKKGFKALEDALEEGLEKAMNRFNTK